MEAETGFMLHALYMGIYITFVYDILRIIRKVFGHPDFLVSLEDMGFWIYCAVKVFLLMYYESNGTLRWFAICSALVGMFVYLKLISRFWVKYASLVLRKIVEIIRKILVFVLRPLFKIWMRVKKKLTLQRKVLKMNLKGRKQNGEGERDQKESCIS